MLILTSFDKCNSLSDSYLVNSLKFNDMYQITQLKTFLIFDNNETLGKWLKPIGPTVKKKQ